MSSQKKILHNTMMLYLRMGVSMLVSLYTSSVILQQFGEQDYGILSIVGGTMVVMGFLNGAMAVSTQRFLNFELGKKNYERVGQIYSMAQTVYFCLAGIFLVLSETIGLWLINRGLNIPADRMNVVNAIYQTSVLIGCIGIAFSTLDAAIISYERFSFYAYVSIGSIVGNLVIALLLPVVSCDKMFFYSLAMAANSLCFLLIRYLYCRFSIGSVIRYHFPKDKKLFSELFSFSWWSLLGNTANVINAQLVNFVLNIFFGVTLNAAMGIANRVNTAIFQFVSNYQVAFVPSVVQTYASGKQQEFNQLLFFTAKLSTYLLLLLSTPALVNLDFLLHLWLGKVPAYTTSFIFLLIVSSFMYAISSPLPTAIQATGKIRKYQIYVSSLLFFNVPLCIIILKFKNTPVAPLASVAAVNTFVSIWRIFYMRNVIPWFDAKHYFWNIFCRTLMISAVTMALIYFASTWITGNWIKLLVSTILSVILIPLFAFAGGLTENERTRLLDIVRKKFSSVFERKTTIQ